MNLKMPPRRFLFLLTFLFIIILFYRYARVSALPIGVAEENHSQAWPVWRTGTLVCEQTRNLVPNPGFEHGIGQANHWLVVGDCDPAAVDPGHDSALSALIPKSSSSKKKCKLLSQIDEIPVESDRYYDYSAWVKANLSAGQAYLAVSFWQLTGTWKRVGVPVQTESVTNTDGEWVHVTGFVQIPAGAQYARVEPTLDESSAGSVWFDDIYLGLSTCLTITQTGQPDPVRPGEPLTLAVRYRNVGYEKASGLEIIEIYDPNVDFRQASPPPFDSTTNVWKLAELLPGAGDTITITVRVHDDPKCREKIYTNALILSEEVPDGIHAAITTTISSEPCICGEDLVPPEQSSTGLPGQYLDHHFTLCNLGTVDGDVNLTATSSLRWNVSISGPAVPTLPYSSSVPITLGLTIPTDAPAGRVNTTWITSTLVCQSGSVVTATSKVTTTVTSSIYLPSITKMPEDSCYPDSWEKEPNNSCRYRQTNGPLCLGREYYGYTDDSWDWFSVYAPAGRVSGDLAIHSGEGIQFALCDEKCCPTDQDDPCYPRNWDITPGDGYHVECASTPGWYYVGVYTESDWGTDRPYILKTNTQ